MLRMIVEGSWKAFQAASKRDGELKSLSQISTPHRERNRKSDPNPPEPTKNP